VVIDSARDALRQCLPESLKDQTFATTIGNEESVQKWLQLLLKNLSEGSTAQSTGSTAPVTSAPLTAAAVVAGGASSMMGKPAGQATGWNS